MLNRRLECEQHTYNKRGTHLVSELFVTTMMMMMIRINKHKQSYFHVDASIIDPIPLKIKFTRKIQVNKLQCSIHELHDTLVYEKI